MESSASNGQQDGQKKMGFFDSVLAPPDWLNQKYVESALQTYEKDPQLQISQYSISPCTKPGDNFVGVIFRATVSYNTGGGQVKNESFIVKIEPFLEGFKKDIMANRPFFTTEGRVYTEILPVMQDLLTNIGDSEIIAPGLVHYGTNPNVLIFKDVAPEGFAMQHNPVAFGQAKEIAQKLGKFHALSFYIHAENPDTVTTFKDGFFSEALASTWDFIDLNMHVMCDLLPEWGPEMKLVAEKLMKLKPTYLKKLMQVYRPQENGLNVLNHGDFHIRNLLFRYDSNDNAKYDAIRSLDYQLSVYASPAIDLAYLMYMIADDDCREHHRDELLKCYHEVFIDMLKRLGYALKPPTLLDFQMEVLKNGLMEFFLATQFMTMFHMDLSKMADIDFSDKSKMPDIARMMFEEPKLKSLLLRLLPQMMYKGYLDE